VAQISLGGREEPGKVRQRVERAPFGHDTHEALKRIKTDPRRAFGGWFVSLATAIAMGAMSYIALFSGEISMAARRGSTIMTGPAATVTGFLLLAAALLPFVRLAKGTRMARPTVGLAVILWIAVLVWYVTRAGASVASG
jgi:hypothetical protein